MAKSKGKRQDEADETLTVVGDNAGSKLKSLVERIERLDAERKALGDDRKEVIAEAKGIGFDTKVVNYIIKLRKMDKDDWEEFETLVDTYQRAIDSAADL